MIPLSLTVDSKPFYQKDRTSEQIKDLVSYGDFLNKKVKPQLIGIELFLVGKDEVMRPDLVAQQTYGYLEEMEKLMKFNDISNPFAINEGDVISVFDIPSMNLNTRDQNNQSERREDIRKQYITPEKKSTVDPRYQDYAKRSQAPKPDPSKGNQPALPPNFASFGDQEIKVVNGKLVLGSGVTKSGDDNSQEPVAKSDFIAKIIKQRIKNT